jgi:DNA-binding PadR family transcriptional regulator
MGKGYLSFSAAVVLQAVANGYLYGFDIIDITGLPGGTVYPALRRLEEAGYLASKWEKHTIAREAARPIRKYYELTRAGQDVLTEAVRRYRMLERNEPKRGRTPKPSSA